MRMSLLTVTLAAALLTASVVRADPIPWGYAGSSSTIYNSNNDKKTSSLSFQGQNGSLGGSSGFVPFRLETLSTAGTATPDSFAAVPFAIGITISDALSAGGAGATSSGVATFKGLFNASSVTTASLLPGLSSWTTPTSASLVLGSDATGWRKYDVQLTGNLAPNQPGGPLGSLAAVVHVMSTTDAPPTNGPPPPPPPPPQGGGEGTGVPAPQDAPEPASLLLAALALPALAYARRRRQPRQS